MENQTKTKKDARECNMKAATCDSILLKTLEENLVWISLDQCCKCAFDTQLNPYTHICKVNKYLYLDLNGD